MTVSIRKKKKKKKAKREMGRGGYLQKKERHTHISDTFR